MLDYECTNDATVERFDPLWPLPPIAIAQEYKGAFRWTARHILQPLPSSLRQATCVMVYGRVAEFQMLTKHHV